MGNLPRFIPEDSLVEVTTRTVHGRYLLRPSGELNEIVVGVIARAARLYGVGVVDFKVLSNHIHMLLVVDDAQQLAKFMGYVNRNIAKEAGRLYAWRERFWGRRYRGIVVSDEAEAQEERLRYMLEQGCKEFLVKSPGRWPGATSTEALLSGGSIHGWWFDRTAEYYARRRHETLDKFTHATEEELELTPLPCWRELSALEHQRRAAEMVREIEVETRKRLQEQDRSPMGAKGITRQDPHDSPKHPSRSPAPRFHTATAAARRRLESSFREFLEWYRQAARELKAGNADAEFPRSCFRPRLPFARGRPDPIPG